MSFSRRPFSLLSNPWLVSATSAAALAILSILLWSPWSQTGISAERPLLFYCAEGMTRPVVEIVRDYEREYGVKVHVTYDGSGKLLSTMTANRGKGDLYLAADSSHMLKAQAKHKDGSALVRETMPVAIIRPVLVVSRRTQAELKTNKVRGIKDLLRSDVRVVLANPELASIGYLSRRELEPPGIWQALEVERKDFRSARVSHVGTVNQVARAVHDTVGTAGIIWDALARQDLELEIIDTPELQSIQEKIWIGVLSNSDQPTAALQFARYLTARDKGQRVFEHCKFTPDPEAEPWHERPKILLSAGAMLKPGVDQAIRSFEQREGVIVETSYGGCGLLTAQMAAIKGGDKTGRFPDAYLSCDDSFMDMVMNKVRPWFDPDSRVVLTRNDIVLIVPKGNKKGITSLEDLKRTDLARIGLAHPTKSALGKLTVDLLTKKLFAVEYYDPRHNERIVHADAGHLMVNQINSLDVAVVYRSNALGNLADLDIIEIPEGKAFASQPFAISQTTEHKYLLQRLLQTITSAESASHFRNRGFTWVHKTK